MKRHFKISTLCGFAFFLLLSINGQTKDFNLVEKFIFPDVNVSEFSNIQILELFNQKLDLLPFKLNEEHYKTSKIGTRHITAQLNYYNKPIYGYQYKINIASNGNILSVYGRKNIAKNFELNSSSIDLIQLRKTLETNQNLIDFRLKEVYWQYKNSISNAAQIDYLDTKQLHWQVVLAANLIDTLHKELRTANYKPLRSDSVEVPITLSVFNPDPLTTSQSEYGTIISDRGDSNYFEINSQRAQVNSIGTEHLGVFLLHNKYVSLADLDFPTRPVISSLNGDFNFNRSEDGFEQSMVLYHITEVAQYTEKLGYLEVDYSIPVDAHGRIDDQSSFSSFTLPPRIQLGIGGVDDAEDADVIIHEYGHAMSYGFSPETNSGYERRALDEGFADYMAVSYSLSVNPFNHEKVFNWDGHNEFWSGRDIGQFLSYPADMVSTSWHLDGRIWGSALLEINKNIGRTTLDEVLFQSMYSYVRGMSITEAAVLLLEADSILNNNANKSTICNLLDSRGLTKNCLVNSVNNTLHELDDKPVEITQVNSNIHITSLNKSQISRVTFTNLLGQSIELQKTGSHSYSAENYTNQTIIAIVNFNDQSRYAKKLVIF